MKVGIDRDLCEANEVCVGFAPAVFEVNDEEQLVVKTVEIPESEIEHVTQAIAACPRNALFKLD